MVYFGAYPNELPGFFNEHNRPDNSVEITEDERIEILRQHSETGMSIGIGSDGKPVLVDTPAEIYIPQQVTRAQGKAALITAGLWSAVESYVEGIEDETEKALALVALNDTTHWSRTSPFLNSAAVALGLSDEDLDNLFIQASEIEL